jgi:hypothetical protein
MADLSSIRSRSGPRDGKTRRAGAGGPPGCDRMLRFLQSTGAQAVIWLAVCAALVAVGFYVVAKVRQTFSERESGTHDLMTNFRELHSQGELSDEEYRTIKATLAARLQREIKDKGEES